MPLFESKDVKSARRQVAIRMGKKKVKDYVDECRRMSGKYRDLARRALALSEAEQCDQYLCRRIQYERQANKWDSFLLRMEDLALRGQMSGAMTGLVQGMQALTREIRAGVSPKDMAKVVAELNLSMTQLETTESQLGVAIGALDYDVGTPVEAVQGSAVPEDMKEDVERMRSELMDEVVVREKTGEGGDSRRTRRAVDDRIQEGMERIRKLKGKTK